MTLLTGEAKERALIGNKIVDSLFKETNLDETLKNLDDVFKTLRFIQQLIGEKEDINNVIQKTENILSILKYVLNQKTDCSISVEAEILQYAKAYAANIKDWKTT